MIDMVTSVADLVFKAKTQEPYQKLLILGLKKVFGCQIEITSNEHALKLLNEYTVGWYDCSYAIGRINAIRGEIADPDDALDIKMRIIKNRTNSHPFTQNIYFTNNTIPNSNGRVYRQLAEEYERIRQDAINRQTTQIINGYDYDIFRRTGRNPNTGEAITVQGVLHHTERTPDERRQAEIEITNHLQRQIENEIGEAVRRRRTHIENLQASHGNYYDDIPCSAENPCSICRELEEERGPRIRASSYGDPNPFIDWRRLTFYNGLIDFRYES